jgi:hypothetical protein
MEIVGNRGLNQQSVRQQHFRAKQQFTEFNERMINKKILLTLESENQVTLPDINRKQSAVIAPSKTEAKTEEEMIK